MDFLPEIPEIFLTVGVAVWVLTYFLGKVRIISKYLVKEEIAIIVGIVTIIIGICTNYFNADPMTSFIYGIIAIYITMNFHDKTVKPIRDQVIKFRNGNSGGNG